MRRTRVLGALSLGCFALASLLSTRGAPAWSGACTTDPESGVEVCEITSVGVNKIMYYDISAYSARYNKIVFMSQQDGGPPQIILANLDGSGTEVLAVGRAPAMSPDGTKVYFIAANGPGQPGMDIYVKDLATRRQTRVTHTNTQKVIQWAPPSSTPRGDVLVYAVDNIAHTIYGDGSADTPLQFSDPYLSDRFHRIRLSPSHPNLILYNRERPQLRHHPLWVYDTETKHTYVPTENASHMLWAPDGLHIAYQGGNDFRFHMVRYDGTDDRVLDPGVKEGTEYCSFAPEGDVLACANVDTTGRMPFPESIFLLSADGTNRVAYVCKHNAQRLDYWGWPALVFAQDRYHIVFRSDASGTPQVYIARLPKDIYKRLHNPPRPSLVLPERPSNP